VEADGKGQKAAVQPNKIMANGVTRQILAEEAEKVRKEKGNKKVVAAFSPERISATKPERYKKEKKGRLK